MVDEQLKSLLEENLEVSKENFKILKKMNRARIAGNIFSFFKWMIIIGISVGSFYYIEPYMKRALDTLGGLSSGVSSLQETTKSLNPGNLDVSPDLMKQLQGLLPNLSSE